MGFIKKLYIGFGLILILVSVVSGILLWKMSYITEKMHQIFDSHHKKVNLSTELKNCLDQSARSINDIALRLQSSNEFFSMFNLLNNYYKASDKFFITMSELEQLTHLDEAHAQLAFIYDLERQYTEIVVDMIHLLQQPNQESSILSLHLELDDVRNQMSSAIVDLMKVQSAEMEKLLNDMASQFHFGAGISIFLVCILIFSCAVIAWSIIANLRKDLNNLIHVIDSVAESTDEDLPRIEIISNDEIGRISSAFNRMAAALEERTRQERLNRKQLQEQHWIKSVVAEITKGCQGINDINELAEWFLLKICPILGVDYGVFYMKRGNWTKIADYASDQSMIGVDLLNEGEGLLGQCATENRKIVLKFPQESYIKIRSGLVQATPKQITIMPISFEGEVTAIVELASLREMSENKLNLLEELLETLGLVIETNQGHMEVQRLLLETQQFTEELQTQSEELQKQQEKLHMLNEQLSEQFKHAEKKSQQLETLKRELEQKNKELLAASEYKSEFLANMSHELRTPLNSLLILSQLLAENKEGNLSTEQLEYAQTIFSSGSDLLHLINRILDLSKIESGKMEVIIEEVLVTDIIESSFRKFCETAKKKGIAFNVIIKQQVEALTLKTDRLKVQQIIGNLVANAIKFTENGSVELLARPPDPFEQEEAENTDSVNWAVAIDVKDTGIGIAPDKIPIIFQSFHQADGTTSRRFGGSGLGLAISKSLTELLGGRLTVESKEGKGSIFTLLLPLTWDGQLVDHNSYSGNDYNFEDHEQKEVVQASEHRDLALYETSVAALSFDEVNGIDDEEKYRLDGIRVLLVDDDMRNTYALTIALENFGADVIVADNGVECLEMLHTHSEVDLVLMDIMMPKMDGYETIRIIRSMRAYQDLPIIALTAKAMKEDRQKCIDAGANDYISKPVQIDQLISLMQVWLHE